MVVALGATLFVGTIPVMVDHEFVALVATQIDVAGIAHIVVVPSPHTRLEPRGLPWLEPCAQAPSAAAPVADVPSPG